MKKFSLLVICSLLLFTGCGEKKIENDVTNTVKKSCCQQYGGRWENNNCANAEFDGMELFFDESGYKECVKDSTAQ